MATQPEGYLALPAGGQGAPILVLHPWWGLNATIHTFCRRLAEAGFVAFAPDLYHGNVTANIEEAERLVKANFERADENKAEIRAAAQFLYGSAGQQRNGIAVIGFSMGAYYAVDLSTTAPALVHSVVLYYGAGEGDYTQAQARYLGHFAQNDQYEAEEYIVAMEQEMHAAGRPVTFHTYPETGHWFCEADRTDVYNHAAAELAWERTVAFLQGHEE